MKSLGVFIGLLILLIFGISIGGFLWENSQIPAWLMPIFFLLSALFLNYWVKGERHLNLFRKYSTTLGVLSITLTGYLLLEHLGLKLEIAYALVFFLLILVFASRLLLIPFELFIT